EPSGAQDPRRLFLTRVELPPEAADGPYDHRVVEEDMRQQDRPDGGVQADAPQRVERAAPSDQREEGRTDNDGRQDERHRHDRPPVRPSRTAVPREGPRRGARVTSEPARTSA